MTATAVPARPADAGGAIGNLMASVVLFSITDALVKWLAGYPIFEMLFFRSFFAFLPLGVLLWRGGGFGDLRTRQPVLQGWRAATGIASMCFFYLGFRSMPLADVIAIAFTGPLFMTVLSIPFLGEQVGPRRWTAVLAGFLGVLLIARPGSGLIGLAALYPLAGAFCGAASMILVRRLSVTDSNASIVCYHAVAATLVGAAMMPFDWVMPTAVDWPLLIAVGLVGGTAQIFLTQAFRLAPAALLAPFKYIAIVFAILFGYLLFGDLPDAWTLVGAGVVIASGLYILHREGVRRAERRPAAA